MYDEIMDDIRNKALADAHKMVFEGPNLAVQAMKVHNARTVIPAGVILQDRFINSSPGEIEVFLDNLIERFEEIELMALKVAVLEVLSQCKNPLDDLEKILAAHDEGDEYSPDDVEVWSAYATDSLQELVDRIDTNYESRRQEYAKVISLVTGIDFKSN